MDNTKPAAAGRFLRPVMFLAGLSFSGLAFAGPEVINVGENADVSSNPTKALTEAFNSSAKKVIVPNLGKPYIVEPILVQHGDKEIILEPGVVIQAKPGAFKKIHDRMIQFDNVKNVTLRGKGAILRMNKKDYQGPDYKPSEFRHALAIVGSDDFLLEDLTVEEAGGDGVFIGAAYYTKPPYPERSIPMIRKSGETTDREIPLCRNVTIRRVVTDRCHRNGMSLISGENFLIEDCVFKNTSGTRPEDGLDIEPSRRTQTLKNVLVRNCISENNGGKNIGIYLRKLKEGEVTIRVENCEVRGGKSYGIVVGAIGDNEDEGISGQILVKDCKVSDTAKAGICVYDKSYKTVDLIFENCVLKNVATSTTGGSASPEAPLAQDIKTWIPPVAPIVFYLRRQPDLPKHFGGITFKDCRVEDAGGRPLIAQEAKEEPRDLYIAGLSGTIRTSQKNPVINLGPYTRNATLQIIPDNPE